MKNITLAVDDEVLATAILDRLLRFRGAPGPW